MRSGESYLQGLREANKATGNWTSEADDRKVFPSEDAYRSHLNGEYIDWVDELMQNGYTQNYSLSVSGGTEKTKGYLSMNFSTRTVSTRMTTTKSTPRTCALTIR